MVLVTLVCFCIPSATPGSLPPSLCFESHIYEPLGRKGTYGKKASLKGTAHICNNIHIKTSSFVSADRAIRCP
eukprot:5660066-Amphidinium_carterae.1